MHIGRYQLINGIARGGMSEVFLARDTTREETHRCIVKRLLPAMAKQLAMRHMFLDEGRVTALFDHPHVVGCSPPEEYEGSWFLVMDYVEGTNLRRLLEYIHHLGFGLPIPLCVHVVACVAAGLDHAHGIRDPETDELLCLVHRDVAPDNILIGVDGEVKIADFGIASGHGRLTKTMHGQTKGKVGYMSPEQADAQQIDLRSDIFSLGIVLHEMLARSPLYAADADFIAMQRLAREAPFGPSRLNADVDSNLDSICVRALQKEPDDRFERAGEMSVLLADWLAAGGYTDPAAMFADWLAQLAANG
jgi:eukaryotic-like serine/threonine-protein kinase